MLDLNYSGLASKIEGGVNTIESAFKKVDKEFNWNKIMNANYFKSINWNSLVSMMFTPANLITFFSAMSAFGIISSINQQNVGAAAGGATGNTSPSDISLFGSQAMSVASKIGTLAGSQADIGLAIAQTFNYISQYGGSISDAVDIVTRLGKSLEVTGGKFSDATAPILAFLGAAGMTNVADINNIVGSIMELSQATGDTTSMGSAATSMEQFGLQAKQGGLNAAGIVSNIQEAGSVAKSLGGNFSDALKELDAMGYILQSKVAQGIFNMPDVAKQMNLGNANNEWVKMNDKIKNDGAALDPIIQEKMPGFLQLVDPGLVNAFEKNKQSINDNYTAIRALGDPSQLVLTQWLATDTVAREWSQVMAGAENDLANATVSSAMTALLVGLKWIVDNKIAMMGFFAALGGIAVLSFSGVLGMVSSISGGIGALTTAAT
ncbi:MAG: hypothetical protein ACYDBV_14245, partial [Nitrospiria bacterium]